MKYNLTSSITAASQWLPQRISSGSVSGGGVRGGIVSGIGVSGSGVSSGGISGSGIFYLPLYLVVNIHLIVRIDLDGASAATKALVADLATASDYGGSRLITILIMCGVNGGIRTGRGDSGGATVGDA